MRRTRGVEARPRPAQPGTLAARVRAPPMGRAAMLAKPEGEALPELLGQAMEVAAALAVGRGAPRREAAGQRAAEA